MSRLTIKPRRPKLPKNMTLMECVKWVMHAKNCSEEEAKVFLMEAINDGRLPFMATKFGGGEPEITGTWRFRDGRFVQEH